MKPLIGITASFTSSEHQRVKNTYIEAVIRAGAIPVILPTGTEKDIDRFVDKFDGFIFTGGGDVNPMLFGEEPHVDLGDVEPERDAFELPFVKAILASNKPLFGICRGMQVLNVALGGEFIKIFMHNKRIRRFNIVKKQRLTTHHIMFDLLREVYLKK